MAALCNQVLHIRRKALTLYREKLCHSAVFVNAAFFWKCRILSFLKYGRSARPCIPGWQRQNRDSGRRMFRLALIADEMTCQSFEGICEIVCLSPQQWSRQLERFRPDLLLCESAWSGSDAQNGCWRWKIYGNDKLWFENRRELKAILAYCRKAGVPTAFWNKEDPAYFGDPNHDFADTAVWFDHVFTTAAECVGGYRKKGCRDVHTLMFGYSPAMFYPLEGRFDSGRAVFFGSWYDDHPQRCKDMERAFDTVLQMGMRLEIYDRYHGHGGEGRCFPEKYRPYVHGGVPYSAIRSTIGTPCFAININTVTDSETMFARRVFELMACGCVILSNESRGMRRMFGDKVWFLGEACPVERLDAIRQETARLVAQEHTWTSRWRYLAETIETKGDTEQREETK